MASSQPNCKQIFQKYRLMSSIYHGNRFDKDPLARRPRKSKKGRGKNIQPKELVGRVGRSARRRAVRTINKRGS